MVKISTIKWRIKEFLVKTKEKALRFIAKHVPRTLQYFIIIQVAARCSTTKKYKKRNPMSLTTQELIDYCEVKS